MWAATDERCANHAFNINNGDLFRWSEMWPKLARFFDLEVAPPLPMSLADAGESGVPDPGSGTATDGALTRCSGEKVSTCETGIHRVSKGDSDILATRNQPGGLHA